MSGSTGSVVSGGAGDDVILAGNNLTLANLYAFFAT
jgi:hypothetical protein